MSSKIMRVTAFIVALGVECAPPLPAYAGGTGRAVARAAAVRVEQAVARQFGKAAAQRRSVASVRKHAATRVPDCRAIPEKCAGLRREAAAERVLASRYPNERIQAEAYLVNRNGRRALDLKTKSGRRIDFVLFSGNRVSRRFEVTSQRADKTAQLAKERRILTLRRDGTARRGPVYVRDRSTGRLAPVRREPSEVIRFH